MRWTLMVTVCALVTLPACAQSQNTRDPDQPIDSAHATPTAAQGEPAIDALPAGVRSWRRVFPKGTKGDRLQDLLDLVKEQAAPEDVFDDTFYDHTSAETLSTILTQIREASGGSLSFVRVLRQTETGLGVELADSAGKPWTAALGLAPGTDRLLSLRVSPQPERDPQAKVYDTWSEVLDDVRALDGEAAVSIRRLGEAGIHMPIALLNEDRAMNIGQVAQLFTLGAVAEAVEGGEASWEDEVAMRPEFRSLPPSQYMLSEDGAAYPLSEYTVAAGTLRDTAAADVLLHHVGRERVKAYYKSLVTDPPAHAFPWLSMRDFAILKLFSSEHGRERYAGDDAEARAQTIAGVPEDADLSLDQQARIAQWRAPRAIDRIGWFASPDEVIDTLTDLRAKAADPSMVPLAKALVAKATVSLSSEVWPTSVVKSGGEPGVFAGAWMMRRYDGAWFAAVLVINDTESMPDGAEATRILAGAADLLTLED